MNLKQAVRQMRVYAKQHPCDSPLRNGCTPSHSRRLEVGGHPLVVVFTYWKSADLGTPISVLTISESGRSRPDGTAVATLVRMCFDARRPVEPARRGGRWDTGRLYDVQVFQQQDRAPRPVRRVARARAARQP
jgi:hypothetical protein